MIGARPRIVVAGAGGDSGKTLVSLGLAAAFRQAGLRVAAFKKGPDYIDAAWLGRAAGSPARNLDAWLMGVPAMRDSFLERSAGSDVSVIEGNRGVLDGLDGHSTAALAKTIEAPVVLVLDVTKVTRTAAAMVAGIQALDGDLRLAAVVANRVGGARHGREVRKAIEEATGVPVVGSIPRLEGRNLLPDRHLGLVPPEEHDRMDEVVSRLGLTLEEHVDLETLLGIARSAPAVEAPPRTPASPTAAPRATIGVFRDSAFTFYYPENLEALEAAGAKLAEVSALSDASLPEVDLLYLGGGFPETQAEALSRNAGLQRAVRDAARAGLPVYAECGGLIYLAKSVTWRGERFPMAGVLDAEIEVADRPQGHGYAEVVVDRDNPFFERGTRLRGHEFHYSRITGGSAVDHLVLDVRRGAGSRDRRDGLSTANVLATWVHLHALGTPEWAPSLVAEAVRFRRGAREPMKTNVHGSAER
jgi:cobyrinic acid a,c-diamide synthase